MPEPGAAVEIAPRQEGIFHGAKFSRNPLLGHHDIYADPRNLEAQYDLEEPEEREQLVEQIRSTREKARLALAQADEVIIFINGRVMNPQDWKHEKHPNPLGETVIATAYISAVEQALDRVGNAGAKIRVKVPPEYSSLFQHPQYSERITFEFEDPLYQFMGIADHNKVNTLALDFGGGFYGNGAPQINSYQDPAEVNNDRCVVVMSNLLYACLGAFSYDRFGDRRFAAAVETLFHLPEGSIDAAKAQPRLDLPDNEDEIYRATCERFGIRENNDAINFSLITQVQAKNAEKAYTLANWKEAVKQSLRSLAAKYPHKRVNLNLISDKRSVLEGFSTKEIEAAFQDVFDGIDLQGGVYGINDVNLEELAIFLHHQDLIASADTGPKHIAEAVGTPAVVVYHPKFEFSREVWTANGALETGVTLEHVEEKMRMTRSVSPEVINNPDSGIRPQAVAVALETKLVQIAELRSKKSRQGKIRHAILHALFVLR